MSFVNCLPYYYLINSIYIQNTYIQNAAAQQQYMCHTTHDIFNKVTSNTRVALPGIVGGAPLWPYPFSGGIVSSLLPPILIPATPIS